MHGVPSTLSLVAVGLYIFVVSGALLVCSRAFQQRQAPWQSKAWMIIALMFVVFGVMRVLGVEDMLQADLRSALYVEQRYETRRAFQGPLFGVIFILAAAIAARLFYYIVKGVKGRRNVATLVAAGCTGAMIILAALRLVSLHSVDALLYGPLKINWIMDIGLSLAVIACAVQYRMVVR
jgi:hypothetical protein